MLSELQILAKQLRETFGVLRRAVADFPADKLTWRPDGNARAVTEIVAHIVSAQRLYVRVINDGASREDYRLMSSPPSLNHAALVLSIDAALQEALACLEKVTPEQLDKPCATSWGDWDDGSSGVPLTVRWMAGQMLRHASYHLGQINAYALMLENKVP
jgi:uncharacterized damage-inducible protein DinB